MGRHNAVSGGEIVINGDPDGPRAGSEQTEVKKCSRSSDSATGLWFC